ncbi:MAG: hypothetical protein EOO44_21095 [Flavobacterium sp.]|nr:MAG: hypothetical protein EOO44_21095 [Flavobacterium sp.]
MKKTILCTTMAAILLMFSCQKDNSQEESNTELANQKEDWLKADLDSKFANSQKQVTAYLFSTNEMAALVNTPNITEVRFVLGYSDNTIQISVTGIDKSGKKLGTVASTILKESNYDSKLDKLKVLSVSKTNKRTALLNAHLLLPKDALTGIQAWQEKLSSVSDLDFVTSYEGLRFRHFSLESEVVKSMVDKANVANVGLFLGINPQGKVTTILIGLDENNNFKMSSSVSKEVNEVYDMTEPCPPNGSPEDE